MSIFKMAKTYYPEKWNKEMIRNLTARGRLTPEQYEEITGEPYAA